MTLLTSPDAHWHTVLHLRGLCGVGDWKVTMVMRTRAEIFAPSLMCNVSQSRGMAVSWLVNHGVAW
jgi:hypothetical protein